MPRKLPILYSALLLTGVNLLLRFVGTSFQIYLSGQIGADGIGLFQLVMSVGGLSMIAGMAGIRTASMYLSAEALGQKMPHHLPRILSTCFCYSICFSGTVALMLYGFAPQIADLWIGDIRTVGALRLYAAFLPVACLCGVMCGYFTAANKIGTLAVVEIAEQICSMIVIMVLLSVWAKKDPVKACQCVILGNCIGTCFTLVTLVLLRYPEKQTIGSKPTVWRQLLQTALPLGTADILKAGINTIENLIVPKRLALNRKIGNPLAAFGIISGMIFPILMFPACILFGLAELLIPELARCTAANSTRRIRYLVKRSLKVTMLYGLLSSGLMLLLADSLCQQLYHNPEAGKFMQMYALLAPMLYCDAVTDAMIKGLGQQTACVRYNILTSALDVALLYILLPKYGMTGYFFSFLMTHLINFLLSLRRLLKISCVVFPFYVPALSVTAAMAAVWGADHITGPWGQCLAYITALGSLLYLCKIIGAEDIRWIFGLIRTKK